MLGLCKASVAEKMRNRSLSLGAWCARVQEAIKITARANKPAAGQETNFALLSSSFSNPRYSPSILMSPAIFYDPLLLLLLQLALLKYGPLLAVQRADSDAEMQQVCGQFVALDSCFLPPDGGLVAV